MLCQAPVFDKSDYSVCNELCTHNLLNSTGEVVFTFCSVHANIIANNSIVQEYTVIPINN